MSTYYLSPYEYAPICQTPLKRYFFSLLPSLYFFNPFICADFCSSALAVCSSISLASQGYSHCPLVMVNNDSRYPDITDLLCSPISLSSQGFRKDPLLWLILVMQNKDSKLNCLICPSALLGLFRDVLLQLPYGVTQCLRSA